MTTYVPGKRGGPGRTPGTVPRGKGGIVIAFTHVLVPTDFSEAAQHALHYALEEATLHHAKVTLLHVLPVHTGTDVYFITGFPGTEIHFDPILGGRLSI